MTAATLFVIRRARRDMTGVFELASLRRLGRVRVRRLMGSATWSGEDRGRRCGGFGRSAVGQQAQCIEYDQQR